MRPGNWISDTVPALQATIARDALNWVGVLEDPPGSNGGPEIDAWLKQFGVPAGSPWCAVWVAKVFRTCGAMIPAGASASSCDTWMSWAQSVGLWQSTPAIGSAVVYGKGTDAQHIGIVVRLLPKPCSVEANTSLDNSPQREGIAVDFKAVNLGWVLGYIRPAVSVGGP